MKRCGAALTCGVLMALAGIFAQASADEVPILAASLRADIFNAQDDAQATIPLPAQTPAIVTVSGHTSTAVSIKTYKIGQEIPKTYAGNKIHNAPGFEFYVSQHYALQSNMGDAYSASLLEVAELAYPHWVDLIGAEPPDPDTRMYMVYASTADLMKRVISNDTGLGPPANYGGGITIYANRSAYNYPSGSLQYHQRALMIHENLHMLQLVVYGTNGLEDFTYSGEQSVYDPVKKQLTVMVFDKATINNWTDVGLSRLQQERPSFADFLPQAWQAGGGPAVAFTQFMWTDPDRFLKWQIWRDEYYQGHIRANSVVAVTESIFGSLDALNALWQAWLQARHYSFHYVDWGWEQEGNTLWSYGFPQHAAFSQTDIRYRPSQKAEYDPYRMDYPTQPMAVLVGPVKRGTDSPVVGATIDFSRNHNNGIAGMGLGVVDSTYYAVMIQKEATLSVFSQDIADSSLALPRKDLPLPTDLVEAAGANGHLYGLTLRIGPNSLSVTIRAGAPADLKAVTFEIPINAGQRERMRNGNMAVLARSKSHGITPYIDDARKPAPDFDRPAAANFWRFEGMDRLETLYKASWRLGDRTPASLQSLQSEMLRAVTADAEIQDKAITDYEKRVPEIVHDVQACKADMQTRALAVADLTGIFILTRVDKPAPDSDRLVVTTTLINRLNLPVTCTIRFSQDALAAPTPTPITLTRYRPRTWKAAYRSDASTATIHYRITWRGEEIAVPITQRLTGL